MRILHVRETSLRVKFVYEGHWIKVKVTGAKNVENSYSCNVKLRSTITPILSNIESGDVCVLHGVVGYCGSSGVTAIFVT